MGSNSIDGVILTDFMADRPGMHQRALGGYSIASLLRNRNLNIQVIDFVNQLPEELLIKAANKLITRKTKLLGISDTFMHSAYSIFANPRLHKKIDLFVELAKRNSPEIKVIQGGASSIYKYPLANITFGGQNKEAELLTYLATLFPNLSSDYQFTEEPFQFKKADLILPNETLPIEISRGCIFSCKFCGFYGRGKKKNEFLKNFPLIKSELIHNFSNFNTANYFLADDTFNESVEKLQNLLRITDSLEFKTQMVCYARLDLIWAYPEMIDLMYRIGVRALVFGIETLHPKAGITIGKGLGFERVEQTLKMIRAKYPDLYLSSGFIVGLPFEELDSNQRTLDWLLKSNLLDNWNFYSLKIDNVSNDVHQSLFSKEIEKYGYTRVGPSGWSRPDLDSRQAEDVAQRCNSLSREQNGLFPWTLFSLLKDHSFSELRQIKNVSVPSIDKNVKLEQYQNRLFEFLGAN